MDNKRKTARQLQRKRQVRRQFIVLGGMLVALIALIVFIVKVAGAKSVQSKDEAVTTGAASKKDVAEGAAETITAVPAIAPETETVEMSAPVTITISAVGDCTLGTDEGFDSSSSLVAKYNEVQDPAYFFQNVVSVLGSDDLTIANLEGTLTTATERQDKTYAFKGDPSYAGILTSGSVEAVNLANNHSKDYGEQSYEDTIANVEAAGITSFGYDRTAVVDVKGAKVGLVGIYELADGMDRADQLKANIQSVKDQGAQLVIVSFHWGAEKENYPDKTQVSLAHMAIDNGADLVLGHHPHVLQGIENYNGKNIVYSLGNFCFGGNKNPSDKDTMIFQQTFTIQDGAVTADNTTNIIPCSLSSSSSYNDYCPRILEGDEKQAVLDRISTYSADL